VRLFKRCARCGLIRLMDAESSLCDECSGAPSLACTREAYAYASGYAPGSPPGKTCRNGDLEPFPPVCPN
jgi:hypothetical protein